MTLKIATPHIVLKIALFLLLFSVQINAQTATSYNFNTAGQLSSLFNGVGQVGSVSQLTTGGISNSGGINLPSGANAIFSTKEGYSLGPAASTDTFESFIQSVGNSGYSGVGFTASVPVSASSDGYYRPTDAIGISVHGGGFIFHNGATNYTGQWDGTGLAAGITATKASSTWDLLNNGSASDWYKIIFKMTRATLSTFDLRVEIWNSDANGTMLDATAAAIFEVKGVANANLANAPVLHSYFNFSGYRVTNFDNFKVNLTGGGSVIQAGAPVVLTSSGSESNGTITANGNVTSENGGTVTERGFVYATTVDPTIANSKVVSGSGLGTFSKSISGLSAATTYYLRAYATNSAGTTSYGSDLSFTTATAIVPATLNFENETKTVFDGSYVILAPTSNNTSGAFTYTSSNTSVATISGATVTIIAPGTTTITATQAESALYSQTSINATLTVPSITILNKYGQKSSLNLNYVNKNGALSKVYGLSPNGTIKAAKSIVSIGDSYRGGKVAYILQQGDPGYDPDVQHGLIAATIDQSSGIKWSNATNVITSATGTATGTGLANTNTIIASQGATATNYAAGLARAYTGGGFNDWYLPSKDELNKLYLNKVAIGGLTGTFYWSSTEGSTSGQNQNYAWGQFFTNGQQNDYDNSYGAKSTLQSVRAVRSF